MLTLYVHLHTATILSEFALIRNMVTMCSTWYRAHISGLLCVTWSCLLGFCICHPRLDVRPLQFSFRAFLVSLRFVQIPPFFSILCARCSSSSVSFFRESRNEAWCWVRLLMWGSGRVRQSHCTSLAWFIITAIWHKLLNILGNLKKLSINTIPLQTALFWRFP